MGADVTNNIWHIYIADEVLKIVLLYMAWRASDDGKVYMTTTKLADVCGINRRTAGNKIDTLLAQGWIEHTGYNSYGIRTFQILDGDIGGDRIETTGAGAGG